MGTCFGNKKKDDIDEPRKVKKITPEESGQEQT